MYDFVIAGARCAGASLAGFLGRQGYRVLLIDKYASPGPALSTHIIGETGVYERLGILDKMENSGAPAITRMRVDLNGSVFESDLVVTSRVIGLRRELLDRYLLDSALSHPSVTLLTETRVIGPLLDGDGRASGFRCANKDGTVRNYYGQVVIGADGARSLTARLLGARQQEGTPLNHCAVTYVYASQIEPLALPAVEWYWKDDSVVLCNPIDRSMHCIALMTDRIRLSGDKDSLNSLIREKLQGIRTLAPRLRRMQVEGGPRGIGPLGSHIRQCYGDGWALVGDAAAYLHPIAGVGIDNAVCCAEYLAQELSEYKEGRKTWQEAMTAYEEKLHERVRPQYEHSLVTLRRRFEPLSDEGEERLRMLCTFPGLVKELGGRSEDVMALLTHS
ncbi:NAD(P)/FAD-dependent oxidoreductase [Paenibacillus chitinolyticus]